MLFFFIEIIVIFGFIFFKNFLDVVVLFLWCFIFKIIVCKLYFFIYFFLDLYEVLFVKSIEKLLNVSFIIIELFLFFFIGGIK